MVFLKRFFLLLLLALVLVPVLQAKFHFAEERQLSGAFTPAPRATFSWDALRDNSFQAELEKYLEDRMGFRAFFIQFHNQLRFSLFKTSTNTAVIIGREGIVFQDAPVLTYLGQESIGRERAQFRAKRLRQVQQDLAARGIALLFVMAPNKARHLPKLLPAILPPTVNPGISNYELYTRELRRKGVEMLNITPLFAAWGDTARYPLFPWSGTHWSAYGATLAADTILNRVEHLVHAPVPRLRQTGPPLVTTTPNPIDGDLTSSMNLLFPPQGPPAVYPQMAPVPPRPGEKRPNLLLVGDSFNWGLMFFSPFIQHAFAPESRFWYYNTTAYVPDSYEHKDVPNEEVAKLNFQQQVESRDIIIILMTEHNLPHSEFGFIPRLFDLYHPITDAGRARIHQLEVEITAKQPWAEASKPGFSERMHEQAVAAYELER
jgi:hypothetical protein